MSGEELKKELEKQLQLLSKLSDEMNLSVQDRLGISAEIRNIVLLLGNTGK